MTYTFLITGGAGMIGSNLAKRLVKDGHRVRVADNLWRGQKRYLEDEQGRSVIDMERDFLEVDLSVADALDPHLGDVDYVYHLADVVAGVGYVFQNEGSVFRQNLLINTHVVNSVRKHAETIKGYIYVGTACSFPAHLQSGVDAAPLRELDQYPASPESAYGWSKLMGEYEAGLMEKETGIPVALLSLHNVFGSPCDFDAERAQVIPSLVRKVQRYPEESFVVWGSGAQGRAFVHVDDVVEALVLAVDKGLGQGVIQIGPDRCTSIRELAEALVKISGKHIEIEYDLSKPEGDRGRCADYSKAREVLGWEPRTTLDEGLGEIYDWIGRQLGSSGS